MQSTLAGEYPATLKETLPQFHVSGESNSLKGKLKWVESGDPTGLYHLMVGEGQNAFVANGESCCLQLPRD